MVVMVMVNIDDKVYSKVGELIDDEDLKVEYPSIKNFIDKAAKEKAEKLEKKKEVKE